MSEANSEDWQITIAQSPLVIGSNATSKFNPRYQMRGMRIGRTNPQFDPKGWLLAVHLIHQV
jgi:hypothetical protein